MEIRRALLEKNELLYREKPVEEALFSSPIKNPTLLLEKLFSSTFKKFSMETMLTEMQPVVPAEKELQYRKIPFVISLFGIFGQSEFPVKETNVGFLCLLCFSRIVFVIEHDERDAACTSEKM